MWKGLVLPDFIANRQTRNTKAEVELGYLPPQRHIPKSLESFCCLREALKVGEGWPGALRRTKDSPVGFFQSSAACVFKGLSMLGSAGGEKEDGQVRVEEATRGSSDRFPGCRGGAGLGNHLRAGSGWRAGWS